MLPPAGWRGLGKAAQGAPLGGRTGKGGVTAVTQLAAAAAWPFAATETAPRRREGDIMFVMSSGVREAPLAPGLRLRLWIFF